MLTIQVNHTPTIEYTTGIIGEDNKVVPTHNELMKQTLTIMGWCFLIFMSGALFTANLSQLIPTNPTYGAEWYKVGISIMFGVTFTIFIIKHRLNA